MIVGTRTLGTLSPAQLAYAETLATQTGLAPAVVTTWIGRESGWDVTNASNNYLNIGPGYTFSTPQQGAAAAAQLINTSSYYSGIRQAAASGNPTAQIAAIQSSPWDAGHYGGTLSADYQDVLSAAGPQGAAAATTTSWWSDILGYLGGALSGVPGSSTANGTAPSNPGTDVLSGLSGIATDLNPLTWKKTALQIVFVVAALGLIALGVARMFPGVTRTVTTTLAATAKAAAA